MFGCHILVRHLTLGGWKRQKKRQRWLLLCVFTCLCMEMIGCSSVNTISQINYLFSMNWLTFPAQMCIVKDIIKRERRGGQILVVSIIWTQTKENNTSVTCMCREEQRHKTQRITKTWWYSKITTVYCSRIKIMAGRRRWHNNKVRSEKNIINQSINQSEQTL